MTTPLFSLPTELLLIIFHQLPSTTKHSFSLTCRRLKHIFSTLCPSLPDSEYTIRTSLARDGIRFTTYAYCSGCKTVHSPKFFAADQLQLPPTIRVCPAAQRSLFIDPTTSCSYNYARAHTEAFNTLRVSESLICSGPGVSLPLDENKIIRLQLRDPYNSKLKLVTRHYSAWLTQYAICASYEVLTLPVQKSASKEQIRGILNGFDIPTCPHVRLGDAVVVDGYREAQHSTLTSSTMRQGVEVWLGEAQIIGADAACGVPGCMTYFKWKCRPSLEKGVGWKTILIHVKRHLGSLISPTDLCWMSQLATVSDEDQLRRYWEDCFAWKDVNLAIEEARYEQELELRGQGRMLGEAEEMQFNLLRRENDYLRHPHRGELYPYPHRSTSLVQPGPADGLPITAFLLRDMRRRRKHHTDTETEQPEPETDDDIPIKSQEQDTWVSSSPSNIARNRNPADLYKPLHTPETILALIRDRNKFNDMQAPNPYQRKIKELFWGS